MCAAVGHGPGNPPGGAPYADPGGGRRGGGPGQRPGPDGVVPEEEQALLLLDRPGAPAGLVVGEVLDFLEAPATATSGDAGPVDPRLLRGHGSWNGQRMLLLDMDALVAPYLGG